MSKKKYEYHICCCERNTKQYFDCIYIFESPINNSSDLDRVRKKVKTTCGGEYWHIVSLTFLPSENQFVIQADFYNIFYRKKMLEEFVQNIAEGDVQYPQDEAEAILLSLDEELNNL